MPLPDPVAVVPGLHACSLLLAHRIRGDEGGEGEIATTEGMVKVVEIQASPEANNRMFSRAVGQ